MSEEKKQELNAIMDMTLPLLEASLKRLESFEQDPTGVIALTEHLRAQAGAIGMLGAVVLGLLQEFE